MPSNLDIERLIPMTPELVSVLLTVVRRVRHTDGRIPLSILYDAHDRVHGQPLPHLFSRQLGARQEVLSRHYVRTVLDTTAAAAGLEDNGEPVRFTPHDFRRLFTTELVGAGLPLHIAATLLGHLDLDTTRGYTAVFPQQVIDAHHKMIAHRRDLRDFAEYREVTPEEWAEFEAHFQLRRVALGDCFRPRTRLHPLPIPAPGPCPDPAPGQHRGQHPRPAHRGTRPTVARRGRRARGKLAPHHRQTPPAAECEPAGVARGGRGAEQP
ncbi:tyrosine-type recombinase/integrase [Amycolatopsis thermoflava]|uniref:tyrosine-type recombinase/integrase n=1 Tax=Amycolatopsis thermoflava TaxID=84480 RepID=UPI00364A0232